MADLFGPDPPPPPAHVPELVEERGRLDGPTWRYRGALIECQGPRGYVCHLRMEGHPLDGMSFGVVGTITPLVDLWTDEGRLPSHMRKVPPR